MRGMVKYCPISKCSIVIYHQLVTHSLFGGVDNEAGAPSSNTVDPEDSCNTEHSLKKKVFKHYTVSPFINMFSENNIPVIVIY